MFMCVCVQNALLQQKLQLLVSFAIPIYFCTTETLKCSQNNKGMFTKTTISLTIADISSMTSINAKAVVQVSSLLQTGYLETFI
jgi:hypothetical protein